MSDYKKSGFRSRGWIEGRLGFMAVLLLFAGAAAAEAPGGRITPNFKDVEFTELVEAVSAATGKSFLIHPRVRARVTMLSSTEMSPPAFYEAFLSFLPVCGFFAVPDGDIVIILQQTRSPRLIPVGLRDLSSYSCVAL